MNTYINSNAQIQEKAYLEKLSGALGEKYQPVESASQKNANAPLVVSFKIKGYDSAKTEKFMDEIELSLKKVGEIMDISTGVEHLSDRGVSTSIDTRVKSVSQIQMFSTGSEAKVPCVMQIHIARARGEIDPEADGLFNKIINSIPEALNKSKYHNSPRTFERKI